MDWSDIGSLLKTVVGTGAPLIGSLIGGPLGGTVGNLLASAFGCANTPDAIHQAVSADPDAAVKLAQVEADNKVQLQQLTVTAAQNAMAADTARMVTVNATMQTEDGAADAFVRRWRASFGYVTAGAFFVVVTLCCYMAVQAISAGNASALGNIPILVGAFVPLFGLPISVLGVGAWHDGKAKVATAVGNAAN